MQTIEESIEHAERHVLSTLDKHNSNKELAKALGDTAFWLARAKISLHTAMKCLAAEKPNV